MDAARRALAEMRRQATVGGETAESQAERRRLESFIAEHSKQAEQTITARWQERQAADWAVEIIQVAEPEEE